MHWHLSAEVMLNSEKIKLIIALAIIESEAGQLVTVVNQ